ncbi:MAG: ArgE/DapE family deacylase, partial [Aedoeadaptatus pacaensis]
MKRHLSILKELIQIESVNDGEGAVAKYIAELFKDYKNIETQIVPSYPGRDNILVKLKGNRPGKIFAVSGHLDVVEPGEGWTYPPFEGAIEGNKMYGRGTCDMKAGVAAALVMLLDLADEGADFAGEVWFIGTVGEEVGMQGALDLVEGGYLDAVDGIIIPEPTKRDGENQAIFASKGSIMYTIHGEGKAAHSSMPELGINAIMTAAEFIQKTQRDFDAITNDPACHNDELGATLNVFSVIEGGRQFNSVPDHVIIKGNARTVPEYDSARAVELLQKNVDANNEDPEKATLTLERNQVL